MKILKCSIAGYDFAFRVDVFEEIIPTVLFKEFPGQKKSTVGFINFRGEEKELLDLGYLLNAEYEGEYINRFIIVLKGRPYAFLIDKFDSIIDTETGDFASAEDNMPHAGFIASVIKNGNYPLYDADAIIAAAGRGHAKKR